jgi:hypothetical protein
MLVEPCMTLIFATMVATFLYPWLVSACWSFYVPGCLSPAGWSWVDTNMWHKDFLTWCF